MEEKRAEGTAAVTVSNELASSADGYTKRDVPKAASGPKGLVQEIEPWPEPVDGAETAKQVLAELERYLALPDGAAIAVLFWLMFSHTHDEWDHSPFLAFQSPVPGCGKTTALKILSQLANRPLQVANMTKAALYRIIQRYGPLTFLIDEADAYFDGKHELRGLLDSGYENGPSVFRCESDSFDPEGFSLWAPKALARIGAFHPTLASRSILIRMQRRRSGQSIERFRTSQPGVLPDLARKLARWAKDNSVRLREASEPNWPDHPMSDRTRDNWRPLLQIADSLGGDWPERARNALRLVVGHEGPDAENIGMLLLSDIQAILRENDDDEDFIRSRVLVNELVRLEEGPWGEFERQELTQNKLAKLLAPFEVRTTTIRDGSHTPRVYMKKDLEGVLAAYLTND